ncbi:hypothetical protein K9N68_37290 (plasmid) [Kovacikia minuta CCNUW1]|uniref:hypothetical protein n=1 Tax=Kovacikia minuta TaxID=2931930 RepID=UPI001CD03687|nr:hypothetical protein [Kovacikia minuta]UBF29868.1 hypothetical protein K9N68_37290 [Kovacikia minuta CCNUW1]
MAYIGGQFDVLEASTGFFGVDVLTGTSPQTPPAGFTWYYLYNAGSTDVTFSSITGKIVGAASLTLTSKAGIGCISTGLTLSAGTLVAYRVPNQYLSV